jgi:hypothetical protein
MSPFWHLELRLLRDFWKICAELVVYAGVYRTNKKQRPKSDTETPLDDVKKPCPETKKISKSVCPCHVTSREA